MYSVTEEKLWRWADGVVEGQKPRVATTDSLTATLYNGRQAKADRCAIAIERRRMVVGKSFSMGNWMIEVLTSRSNSSRSQSLISSRYA
jgi:hypothetical protein